jgi:hypothetical protein
MYNTVTWHFKEEGACLCCSHSSYCPAASGFLRPSNFFRLKLNQNNSLENRHNESVNKLLSETYFNTMRNTGFTFSMYLTENTVSLHCKEYNNNVTAGDPYIYHKSSEGFMVC